MRTTTTSSWCSRDGYATYEHAAVNHSEAGLLLGYLRQIGKAEESLSDFFIPNLGGGPSSTSEDSYFV